MPKASSRWRADRLIAVGVLAASLIGAQALNSVSFAKPTPNPVTGCSEDSFLGGAVSPDNGSTVTVELGSSQTFSVVYHDEKPINLNIGFTPQYTVTDSDGHVVQSGTPATSPTTAPAGVKDPQNPTLLSVDWVPSSPGDYTVTIKAWDGDQNKDGGDCGAVSWSVNTPAPPTTTTPPTTTPPTTQPPGPTTTTTAPPSTPQTNVLGEQFSQSPTAAAQTATPALTG